MFETKGGLVRRRPRFAVVVVGIVVLAALMPAAALAAGSGHAHQGVRTADGVNGLEVQSSRGWCATVANCGNGEGNYGGGAPGMYAEADAWNYNGSTHATPDEIYGECGRYSTDSMGVLHYDYMYVDAYLSDGEITNSSLVWLMNSGSESNTQAMALIRATGAATTYGDGTGEGFTGFDAATISGFGTFNNETDMTYTNSGFTVTLVGTIFHDTIDTTEGYQYNTNSTSIGSMTCKTNPLPENGLFAPFQYQFYLYGEAELESLAG